MSTKGIITDVWIGDTGHGMKSFYITISHETGASQGFGGYSLGYNGDKVSLLERMIKREVPKILNRKDWEDLVGTQVDIEGTFNKINRIGVDNNWVDFEVLFEPYHAFAAL